MMKAIFKKYLSKIGNEIKVGSLTVILPNGETLVFSGEKGLKSDLKLNSYMPVLRTVFGGHLGFAESYLKGEWTSSNLESFLEIMVTNLPDSFNPRSSLFFITKLFIFLEKIQKLEQRKILCITTTWVMIFIKFG